MLAICEHASGMGGMYVYDAYLQGMWAGAAVCPLMVEKTNKKQNNNKKNWKKKHKKETDATKWEMYLKNGGKFGEDYT